MRDNTLPAEPQDEEQEFFVMRQHPRPVLNTAPLEPCEPVNLQPQKCPLEHPQEIQRSMQNLRLYEN